MTREMIVLLAPSVTLAASGGVIDVGPLFGGPRAVGSVGLVDYARGQEVLLEIHATSDRPGAEKVFLGQSKTVVAAPGAKFVRGVQMATLISDPLPDTQKEWKIQVWHSPKLGSTADSTLLEFVEPRTRKPRK